MKVKVPPLKIQGIKTKLVPFILKNITWHGQGKWIEPFLGSGVVVFNVRPDRALLADVNPHIISVYQAIQQNEITPENLRYFLNREGQFLSELGDDYYYEVRNRFNEGHSPLDYLFLNRSCFNGMMRFNANGQFNVPFCRKPNRFSQAYITKICNQVGWVRRQMEGRKWEFVVQDWRETLSQVTSADFVYLDPPYNDRHTDYFNQWNEDEANALACTVKELASGFAYSTWKQNKFRVNSHLSQHFSDYPIITKAHFYHVGATESLRHAIQEALVIAPSHVAKAIDESLLPAGQKQLALLL